MKEDIEQLRQLIRDLNLLWLDEELEEVLSIGKLQQKDVVESKQKISKGIARISYSENEQLKLLLDTIKSYYVVLPIVEKDAEAALRKILSIETINFVDDNGNDIKKPDLNTQKLTTLLNEIQ